MMNNYKKHLLHLIEQEISNHLREFGEPAPLIEAYEMYPTQESDITYNVLFKHYYLDESKFYIAKIYLAHYINIASVKQLNEILEGSR